MKLNGSTDLAERVARVSQSWIFGGSRRSAEEEGGKNGCRWAGEPRDAKVKSRSGKYLSGIRVLFSLRLRRLALSSRDGATRSTRAFLLPRSHRAVRPGFRARSAAFPAGRLTQPPLHPLGVLFQGDRRKPHDGLGSVGAIRTAGLKGVMGAWSDPANLFVV